MGVATETKLLFFCLFVLEIAADFLNFFVWSAVSKLLIFLFLSFFVWGGVTIVAKLFYLFFFVWGWLLKLSYCFFCFFVLELAANFLNF